MYSPSCLKDLNVTLSMKQAFLSSIFFHGSSRKPFFLVISTDKREVFCWGWNNYGQVKLHAFLLPTCVGILTNETECYLYIDPQLGLGDAVDRRIPSHVPVEACHLTNVACGWWHTPVLAESPT